MMYNKQKGPNMEHIIEIKGLNKSFGEVHVVRDLSFHVDAGALFAFLGVNGAGKSTFLRTLCGVYQPDDGQVLIDGKAGWDNPEVKRRIAYVPDELYFLPGASLERMARMYVSLYPDFDAQRFWKLCEQLQLPRKKSLGQFSKGMRRQAATILALACRPD